VAMGRTSVVVRIGVSLDGGAVMRMSRIRRGQYTSPGRNELCLSGFNGKVIIVHRLTI
jgi:hypothetical protein